MRLPPRDRRARPSAGRTIIRHLRPLLLALILISILIVSVQLCAAVLRRANALGRRCTPSSLLRYSEGPLRISIVSFSDESEGPRRSFRGMMEAIAGNKRAYGARMGYDFIDASGLVDRSRPPNWSKISAVRSLLRRYHWIFWNDADTVVTNPEVSLENILQAAIGHSHWASSPDFVFTQDFNGVNSGVFFVRQSEWSELFLDKWWNQTSFIQFGSTKSGDNAALKYLIDSLPAEEQTDHIRISPMQCLFNSYPWSPSWKSLYRLVSSPQTIWRGCYSTGDFMVHFAGLDEKTRWAHKILDEINSKRFYSR